MSQAKTFHWTEASPVFDTLTIQSHKGPYTVTFDDTLLSDLTRLVDGECHFLVDANVARLYAVEFDAIVSHPNTIVIEASEESKSIQKIVAVIEWLVQGRVRRDHTLVAIGGGVIQDITCFIASTLLRGLRWRFVPTTLLSQADSCIGSKSSVNLGATKNILGTFYPPQEIFVSTRFLDTLEEKEIRSGVGEIIKVHAIEGARAFDLMAADFQQMFTDRAVLMKYIRSALLIKQRFIELDEFDRGVRNIFNYGHSFGHAIESATEYLVPHGIAVSMGMDMANHISRQRNLLSAEHYQRMHAVLRQNYHQYANVAIPLDNMFAALMKDKKNTSTMLGLIFSAGPDAAIQPVKVAPDDVFRAQCKQFLEEMRA
jgi:3-dehydroquinate synthase